jgi:hypothetical protein
MAQDGGEKTAIERAAEKELEAYRRQKQEERRRLAEPARTERDPHPGSRVPKDAERDQTIAEEGSDERR